jgi:hypothetical protein
MQRVEADALLACRQKILIFKTEAGDSGFLEPALKQSKSRFFFAVFFAGSALLWW